MEVIRWPFVASLPGAHHQNISASCAPSEWTVRWVVGPSQPMLWSPSHSPIGWPASLVATRPPPPKNTSRWNRLKKSCAVSNVATNWAPVTAGCVVVGAAVVVEAVVVVGLAVVVGAAMVVVVAGGLVGGGQAFRRIAAGMTTAPRDFNTRRGTMGRDLDPVVVGGRSVR